MHSPPSRSPATHPAKPARGDLAKDLGAIIVYGFGLAAMFFAGEIVLRPVHEETLVMILASIAIIAVIISAALRSLGVALPFDMILVRWIPASLLLLSLFSFLIGLFTPGNGNEDDPGLGKGLVLMIVLVILAAAPRRTEDAVRTRVIWGWFAAGLLGVLTIVNLIIAFQSDWPESSVPAALIAAGAAAALLWLPIPAGRLVAAFVGTGMLVLSLILPGEASATWVGGEFSAILGFPVVIMLAGLLAVGFMPARENARQFADGTAWVIAFAACAALVGFAPALFDMFDVMSAQVFLVLAGVAAVWHLVVRRSDRRARVLPALVTTAAILLLAAITLIIEAFDFPFGPFMHELLVLAGLALLVISRLDRDPGFRILTPSLTAYHSENAVASAAMEASAYRQSAGVLAGLSLLTGPVGILLGQMALGRANRAETSGLETTAIRMVAGTGIVLGVATAVWLFLFVVMVA